MSTLPSSTKLAFLAPEHEEIVAHIQEAHRPLFDFVHRLTVLAHEVLIDAKVNRSDLQQLLLASLEHKALTAFQAIVILVERGLSSEARIVLRTLLEVTFRIVAIAKDKDVGIAYVLEDQVHRKKFIDKHKKLSDEVRNEASDAIRDDLQSTIAQNIKDKDIKELKTSWFAQNAGMMDFYNSAYAVLSGSVHVNVRSLESALQLDEDENIIGLSYGPSDEDLEIHIVTACEALILSLLAVHSIVDKTFDKQLNSFYEELKSLLTVRHAT